MQSAMRRTLRAAGGAITLAIGAAGCGDASGPADGVTQGRYTLAAVNGAPLPYVVTAGLRGPSRVLVGGSLTMRGNQLTDVRNFHLGPVTASAPDETDSASYAFTQERNLLLVQRPRGNPALSYVDSGEVRGTDITLFVRILSPADLGPTPATLLYRRAP